MFSQQDNWCFEEFHSIKLGDKRLDQRLLAVASCFLAYPTRPIHVACGTWSSAKAAYRLFDNQKLKEEILLQKHQLETVKRLEKEQGRLFAIQDTTTLNYTHHPKKRGINKINKNPGFKNPTKGCFLHHTMLMTENKLPLGLIDQKIFQHPSGEKIDHKRRPIEEKQSFRWIEALRKTVSLCSPKQVVTICDRESDIFEFFTEAKKLNTGVLVRASMNRILVTEGKSSETLWNYMKKVSLKGRHQLFLPPRGNQPKREVKLEVRFSEVTLKPPQRYPGAKGEKLFPLKMQAVWFYEPNISEGIERIEWMLLTNLPVGSIEEGLQIGRWYSHRWQIEIYHRVLKSGCKIEECRLETYERLKKYIRLKSIIAIRLLWIVWINRTEPEATSEKILKRSEWEALECYFTRKKKPPSKAPLVREAVRKIAKLGGFLGRKNDKEPGMTYIWRGWEKLALISEFYSMNLSEMTYG